MYIIASEEAVFQSVDIVLTQEVAVICWLMVGTAGLPGDPPGGENQQTGHQSQPRHHRVPQTLKSLRVGER